MTMTLFRALLCIGLLYVGNTCNGAETKGKEYFAKGVELVQQDLLDEAATNFWGSIITYTQEDSDSYGPEQAMQNFLLCYQKQNKLGLGYAFVAAQMFKAKDGRARSYMKLAHQNDPENADIRQLLRAMGETAQSILSDRVYSLEDEQEINENTSVKAHACRTRKECATFIKEVNLATLEPGWENKVQRDYVHAQSRLINTPPINVKIPPMASFQVAYDHFWVQFLESSSKPSSWEPETFQILHDHITPDTIVVDLGAWYGPTSFFSAHVAKQVFSLEPDPVAYATLQHNINLNPNLNVRVHAIAVVTPADAGYVTLKTRKMGNSESMIVSQKSRSLSGTDSGHFEAAGYTLPFLLNIWGIDFDSQPVFIKIDIEAYECKLIPSLHEFLVEESKLPTIFVSFHPQLRPCSKSQMMGALETMKLFGGVTCNGQKLPLKDKSTFEEFESMLDTAKCLTEKSDSDFVLTP